MPFFFLIRRKWEVKNAAHDFINLYLVILKRSAIPLLEPQGITSRSPLQYILPIKTNVVANILTVSVNKRLNCTPLINTQCNISDLLSFDLI